MMLKMAVLAPMPAARVRAVTAAKPKVRMRFTRDVARRRNSCLAWRMCLFPPTPELWQILALFSTPVGSTQCVDRLPQAVRSRQRYCPERRVTGAMLPG